MKLLDNEKFSFSFQIYYIIEKSKVSFSKGSLFWWTMFRSSGSPGENLYTIILRSFSKIIEANERWNVGLLIIFKTEIMTSALP